MMTELKTNIYLPIEVYYREFKYKSLFSLMAANKNFRVYLGSKEAIYSALHNNKEKNKGIFFYKGIFFNKKSFENKLAENCEFFIVLDEELGVGIQDLKSCLEERIRNFKVIDKFFVIGENLKKKIVKYDKNFKSKIFISGWPKYDLYTKKFRGIYEDDVKKLKDKYGNFYLFSSNFGVISKKSLNEKISEVSQNKFIIKNKKSWINVLKNGFADLNYYYLNFFSKLEKKTQIILRPHPGDYKIKEWFENYQQSKNFKIEYDNDIIPWLIASKGLIHRGCSTAVDALLLKKKSFFLLPKRKLSQLEKKNFPYKISIKIKNFNDLKKFNKKKEIKNLSYFRKEIYNFEKKKKLTSSEVILSEIIKLKAKKQKKLQFNCIQNFYKKMLTNLLYILINLGLKRENMYIQKMPKPIKSKDVENIAKKCFPNFFFIISQVSANLVMIEKK
jgi:surface carbohydrate biosynthesis protein